MFEKLKSADAVIAAVAHREYREMSIEQLRRMMNSKPLLIDIKGTYKRYSLEEAGIRVWRL